MHCVVSARFLKKFFNVFFYVWFSKSSLSFWNFPPHICGCHLSIFENHSEALCTWACLFIWWSGLFIKAASKFQYVINLFLWCHWASPKNRRGRRNRNLPDVGAHAHKCERMCVGGVANDVLYYYLILCFLPHYLLCLHSSLCSRALSFLGSVPKISLFPFGLFLHSMQVVPLLPWSVIIPSSFQVYINLMNSLECFGLPSFSIS